MGDFLVEDAQQYGIDAFADGHDEVLRGNALPGGVKVAEVSGVHDMDVETQSALGAVEVEITIGCRWR